MITVFSGIVTGPDSAEDRVLSVGEGATAVLEALELSPAVPGVEVAVGWPAGAGSLLLPDLFPQAAEKIQSVATNANFLKFFGIKRFSPRRKRNRSRSYVLAHRTWQAIVTGARHSRSWRAWFRCRRHCRSQAEDATPR
ncbi:MAG: hypothetical protein DMG62_04955 [Acidobacteria bacterium]|nr:MAG: hypothetical protein DMG63_04875 [Acidobacteriota bacterium]PYY24068.1 MAG: hypothetical protein DMG62_04955 [Acidobacteriota bacterium]